MLITSLGHSQEINFSSNAKISTHKKMGVGSQFYNYYTINVLGVEYNFLYLSDEKEIKIVTTKDPKFTINGKNYWNIPYKDFSEEIKGYSFIYGLHFVKFDNGWLGCYGLWQPSHMLKNGKPVVPNDEVPMFFVKSEQ